MAAYLKIYQTSLHPVVYRLKEKNMVKNIGWTYRLTATVFIGTITTVNAVIASPADRNTVAIVASELLRFAVGSSN